MVVKILLYIALAVFLMGLIYKITAWFSKTLGVPPPNNTFSNRIAAFIVGFIRVIFSLNLLIILKTFLLDVILQRRTFRESRLRWVMHMTIFGGFMLLLIMHALGRFITSSLFDDYYSTINPFFFLRDLFGMIVILGVIIAIFRRSLFRSSRLKTNVMDRYAIFIVAVIILSGIVLIGMKITAYSDFTRMVEDYSDLEDEEDIRALECLWVKDFGLVSPNVQPPFEKEIIDLGKEYHELNCLGCHASTGWSVSGYATAKLITPIALYLDSKGVGKTLYLIHVIACFVGLAYLPFSKMFHLFSTPISMIANSVMDEVKSDPLNIATRQVMELDACTHCGTCSLNCSAMMAYEALRNEFILPSEKMVFLKKMVDGKKLDDKEMKAIQEGVYLCTNCDRCTVVCPSGIRLKELWINVRENLIQKGTPEPFLLSPLSLVRGLRRKAIPADEYSYPINSTNSVIKGDFDRLNDESASISFPTTNADSKGLEITDSTFAYCFGCYNCTNVCPVVNSHENPQESLGLLPHQIMCCLGLGLYELASGPAMLWDCVTCYQCQEHCPQQVKVTDILYNLKNAAVKKVRQGVGGD